MSSSVGVAAAPGPGAWPEGVARVVLEEVDGTNAEALRRAPERPTWILAHRQTAPRGSRGRPWSMPEGNFGATLALPQRGTPPGLSRMGFVAGLALHDALGALTGRPRDFAMKWPNDVLMGGGKVAGVLLERERSWSGGGGPGSGAGASPGAGPRGGTGVAGRQGADDAYTLAIGFGVNLASAPAEVAPGALPAVTLGGGIEPERLLDALAPAFAARRAQAAEGFEPVRRDWLARAAGLGGPIVARTLRTVREGVFETIDGEGHLVLRTAEGRERVASADVFFAPAPGAG